MRAVLLIVEQSLRWQSDLIRACENAGFVVAASRGTGGAKKLAGLDLVLAFEQLVYRAHGCALETVAIDDCPADDPVIDPEIVIDVSGASEKNSRIPRGTVLLRPLYDGSPNPLAAVSALLDYRAPKISIELSDSQGCRIVARGDIAIRDRRILSYGLDQTFARVTTLLLRVLRELRSGVRPETFTFDPAVRPSNSPFYFAASALAGKISGFLTHLVKYPEHWRVAFRQLEGAGVLDSLQWPQSTRSPWQVLPDDGRRFYADPFIMARDGRAHLFVEEFPYATGKGVISHCLIGANGTTSAPKPVLEARTHLSYPFVFEHGGEVYMIPESGAARQIALYRAQRFPDVWALDCILLEDIEAYDATLVEHEGRFWIFAALAEGATTHDALALFYADELRGPWHAHPRNPVLVDVRSARPAGSMISRSGQLMRIVQDCSESYGSGMAICKVDTLDTENYRQSVLTRLRPPSCFQATGTHTLNRCAGVEVIDFKQPMNRLRFDALRTSGPRLAREPNEAFQR